MLNVDRRVQPKGALYQTGALSTFFLLGLGGLDIMDKDFFIDQLLAQSGDTPHKRPLATRYVDLMSVWSGQDHGDAYTEKHHILPKSIWPEYSNLSKNRWNMSVLTARQHFLAHWLLAQLLGKRMWIALKYMMDYGDCRAVGRAKVYERAKAESSKALSEAHLKSWAGLDENARRRRTHAMRKAISERRKDPVFNDHWRESLSLGSINRFSDPLEHQRNKEVVYKAMQRPETRRKLRESSKKRWDRKGSRAKSSDIFKGLWSDPEFARRARQGISEARKKLVTCPHCKKSGQAGGMKRWHFDHCRQSEA